ncbi:MAG: glycosyltransferase family 2 protein [Flammeovirgaceae bacterium]|jgi:glycosyltransferase involved in cell wall biosynthesis|nr:glycosyltransferase family 2 protein [Flammeovirgaceae bacterium]
MRGVSVIICCYNSAGRLPNTLFYLSKQTQTIDLNWEIVIVDNASIDETSQVAFHEWKKYKSKISLRVVNEPKQGQFYARERGISESIYDTLVFCDDDNWLEENFVSIANGLMASNPRVGAIGGLGKPFFEASPPKWFSVFIGFFAIGEQNSNFSINGRELSFVYGAGMVVSRAAINELKNQGFTPITTGRSGKRLVSGDDTELCYALQKIGYLIVYSNQLKFLHFMPTRRLTLFYVLRLVFAIGYSSEYLFPYKAWFDPSFHFPYPNTKSFFSTLFEALKSLLALFLPISRYGSYIEKLRNFMFVMGSLQFQFLNQSLFKKFNSFLSHR